VAAMQDRHPLAIEETFYARTLEALQTGPCAIVDDLDLILSVVSDCGGYAYPRKEWLHAALAALNSCADASGNKLVYCVGSEMPDVLRSRMNGAGISKLEPQDYEFLCAHMLPRGATASIDAVRIHRFVPNLTAHQIGGVCSHLSLTPETADTDRFIEILGKWGLSSNVNLAEVQAVDLHDLKGIDDVIESLEANIILPLENDELAAELEIKPKRGVLLAGPPGTGKTTVGRALARRLKSKFFLIDGTVISGTNDFYRQVSYIFNEAKRNAPAILFIDDSDVLFESGDEFGLYRYLLTMLDGLESETAARVCVILTAMDVSNLPPALIRSGRVELWLEMRAPDVEARRSILFDLATRLPSAIGSVDLEALISATDGMTGADMKRLVEDGKLLFAHDRARGLKMRPATDYFLQAIETVRVNRERYEEAEAQTRGKHTSRPPWFDVAMSMAAEASAG